MRVREGGVEVETGEAFYNPDQELNRDLTIAVLGTALSMMIGAPLGALVGYYNNRGTARHALSIVVLRVADVLQAFPVFVLAIALVAVFGQGVSSVIAAIVFVNLPIYMRLARTEVLAIRKKRFVEASAIAGVSDFGIIMRTILPNSMSSVLAHFPINIGWSILLTSGLSFVGAGVVAPTPEWGAMIATGYQNVVTGQWWPSVFPGAALAITVYGFALIGSSMEILYDPRRRAALMRGEVA